MVALSIRRLKKYHQDVIRHLRKLTLDFQKKGVIVGQKLTKKSPSNILWI